MSILGDDDSQDQFAAEGGFAPMTDNPKEAKASKSAQKEAMKAEQDQQAREALQTALRDLHMHFDGEKYWSKLEDGRWVSDTAANAAANVRQDFNLYKPDYVEQVLHRVRKNSRIDGVFPYIHNKQEIMREEGGTFLNISRRQVIAPALEPGEFTWLQTYFDNIFDPAQPIQRDLFLAWFQRLYKSSLEGNLLAGQAVIIAGPTGTGKTLMNYKIIGAALGGHTDAAEYLLGKTAFNKEAAETAVWCVDDNRGGATWEKHDEFANALKRYVANPKIPYHPKFCDATTVTWRGRIVVTCNLDEKSLSILPELDDSIVDKLLWFKTSSFRPDFKDVEAVIERELPFFLRWLIDWAPPADVIKGDERFRILPYQHPDLVAAARTASADYQLSEMLRIAIHKSIINDKKEVERWMTASEIRECLDIEGLRGSLAKFANNRLGIALSKLSETEDTKHLVRGVRRIKGFKQYLLTLDKTAWL